MCYLLKVSTAFQRRAHSFAVHHSCFSTDITGVNRNIFRSGTYRKSVCAEIKLIISRCRKRLLTAQYFIPIDLKQFICPILIEIKHFHDTLQAAIFHQVPIFPKSSGPTSKVCFFLVFIKILASLDTFRPCGVENVFPVVICKVTISFKGTMIHDIHCKEIEQRLYILHILSIGLSDS